MSAAYKHKVLYGNTIQCRSNQMCSARLYQSDKVSVYRAI